MVQQKRAEAEKITPEAEAPEREVERKESELEEAEKGWEDVEKVVEQRMGEAEEEVTEVKEAAAEAEERVAEKGGELKPKEEEKLAETAEEAEEAETGFAEEVAKETGRFDRVKEIRSQMKEVREQRDEIKSKLRDLSREFDELASQAAEEKLSRAERKEMKKWIKRGGEAEEWEEIDKESPLNKVYQESQKLREQLSQAEKNLSSLKEKQMDALFGVQEEAEEKPAAKKAGKEEIGISEEEMAKELAEEESKPSAKEKFDEWKQAQSMVAELREEIRIKKEEAPESTKAYMSEEEQAKLNELESLNKALEKAEAEMNQLRQEYQEAKTGKKAEKAEEEELEVEVELTPDFLKGQYQELEAQKIGLVNESIGYLKSAGKEAQADELNRAFNAGKDVKELVPKEEGLKKQYEKVDSQLSELAGEAEKKGLDRSDLEAEEFEIKGPEIEEATSEVREEQDKKINKFLDDLTENETRFLNSVINRDAKFLTSEEVKKPSSEVLRGTYLMGVEYGSSKAESLSNLEKEVLTEVGAVDAEGKSTGKESEWLSARKSLFEKANRLQEQLEWIETKHM